jgi:hypothetical protein
LIAIADEGRELSGKPSLDGPSETLDALYNLPARAFHDITTGANSNYAAAPRYDLVTGRGSPFAQRVAYGLVVYDGSTSTSTAVQHSLVTPTLATSSTKHRSTNADLFSTTEIL